LSKDIEGTKEKIEKMISTSVPLFLDSKQSMIGNRVMLASYPRSGNSFLRKIIEQVTGIFTGSDYAIADCMPLQH